MGYGSCWMTAPVLAAPAIEELLGVRAARRAGRRRARRPARWRRPSPRRGGPSSDVLEFR